SCNVDIGVSVVNPVLGEADLTAAEKERILVASREAIALGWDITTEHKFYLCDSMAETDFRKDSFGGIMGHRYLDLQEVLGHKIPADLRNLAAELRQHRWK